MKRFGETYDENEIKELIKGVKHGKLSCFQKVFDQYSKPLYYFSLIYMKTNELAEDVVQEVFLKIWDSRKNINTNSSFKAYLFQIAINTIRKHFRSQAVRNSYKHELLISISDDVDDLEEQENYLFLLNKLEALINKMPEKRRVIFIKSKLENWTYTEIAEIQGVTVKTVEYHMSEAMKFLKEEFKKLDIAGFLFFTLFLQEDYAEIK